jgi:hypothetical protein
VVIVTDAELLAAQHRVIINMASCTCGLQWRHVEPLPKCPVCMIIEAYNNRALADVGSEVTGCE